MRNKQEVIMCKKVLLIGGGGTLGSYASEELLKKNCITDVICLENKVSGNKNLHYFNMNADLNGLTEFLKNRYYDGIINFIHYTDPESYKSVHRLLCEKTSHLVFLSSYRVYADLQHPVTEDSPQLYDVCGDELFLKTEDYAVPKSKCEHFIREESGTSNWTIVRPVISFSDKRLDIVTVSGHEAVDRTARGEKIYLPIEAKDLTAGLDWAGNSGKLIADLSLNDRAFGETYTVSSAQNLTWGEVADIYTELIGADFEWIDTKAYSEYQHHTADIPYILKYDRLFDRKIDNAKILDVTGFAREDFISVKDGIKIELEKISSGQLQTP